MYRVSLKERGQNVYIADLDIFINYGRVVEIDERKFDKSKDAKRVKHLLNVVSDGINKKPDKNIVETEADLNSIEAREYMTVIIKNFNNQNTPVEAIYLNGSWRAFGGSGSGDGSFYVHPDTHPATMIEQDSEHRFVSDEDINRWNNKSDFSGNYEDLTNKPIIPADTSELTKSDVYTKDEVDNLVSNVEYDDTNLKNRVLSLESDILNKAEVSDLDNKADKVELSNYRLKNDEITEGDLSVELQNKINSTSSEYDDSSIRKDIEDLENLVLDLDNEKVDKSELNNYREKSVKIDEDDLSEAVKSKLNSAGGANKDDLDQLQSNLTDLENEVNNIKIALDDDGDGSITDTIANLKSQWEDADDDLRNLINNKANVSDLSDYRKISDKINESDLSNDVLDKLGYDDTLIKSDVNNLQNKVGQLETEISNKVDNSQLNNYRLKSDKITESDLDETVKSKLDNGSGYDDTALVGRIDDLEANKADKTDLANYREINVEINEDDLSEAIKVKLNSIGYDDTALTNKIDDLETNKVDKSELNDYRKISDAIVESDLSTELQDKINNMESTYDDTIIKNDISDLQTDVSTLYQDKADKTDLVNYRLKTDKITEVDLDQNIIEKLDSIGEEYDDTQIKADITNLETQINNIKTALDDDDDGSITDTIANLKSQWEDADNDLKNLINNKADLSDLNNYRKVSELINESDLSEDVKNKLNKEYDDTEVRDYITNLQNDISNLENDKVDKTELDNYRSKLDKIEENDLSQTLRDIIDGYEMKISSLESSLNSVLSRVSKLEQEIREENIYGNKRAIEWEFDFIASTNIQVFLKDQGFDKELLDTDVFGESAFNGGEFNPDEVNVRLYLLGPTGVNHDPIMIPLQESGMGLDAGIDPVPPFDSWIYDSSSTAIYFSNVGTTDYNLRLVKFV